MQLDKTEVIPNHLEASPSVSSPSPILREYKDNDVSLNIKLNEVDDHAVKFMPTLFGLKQLPTPQEHKDERSVPTFNSDFTESVRLQFE